MKAAHLYRRTDRNTEHITFLTGFETMTSHFLAVLINYSVKVGGKEFSVSTNIRGGAVG
jgi:hypothetical protein